MVIKDVRKNTSVVVGVVHVRGGERVCVFYAE